MATVIRQLLLLFVPIIVLTGCDPFYGPTLSNGFGSEVDMTVVYSDGLVSRTTWPPCRTTLIGRKGQEVVRLSVEKDGNMLLNLSANEIQDMVKKELGAHDVARWSIGPRGIKLDVGKYGNDCHSSTE